MARKSALNIQGGKTMSQAVKQKPKPNWQYEMIGTDTSGQEYGAYGNDLGLLACTMQGLALTHTSLTYSIRLKDTKQPVSRDEIAAAIAQYGSRQRDTL